MRSRSLNVTRVAVTLVMLASARALPAQPSPQRCDLLCLSRQAREALAAREYDDYLRLARAVAMRAPDHPGGHYAVARAFALLGQSDSAFAALERLLNLGAAPDITADSVFAPISTAPAFHALEAEFERNATPILRGQALFSLPDADLVPEALTWDPERRRWLIGSLAKRKIIAANDEGTSADFISHPDLLRVVGIHADPGRELLWFATWEPTERVDPSGSGGITRTRMFKADLATGRILATYEPLDTAASQLLNDLAIAPSGDLYVTDTRAGRIYRLAADRDSLEVFARPDPARFSYANGIALASDDRTLYVAFIEGLARIDPDTRRVAPLRAPTGVSTAQVDGLYWYRGDLIAVQNAPGLERVVRYDLNAAGDSIVAAEVLERSRDLLRVPTTGAIVGTRFYYIANSQADRLDSDNRLSPATVSPAPLTVVRVIELESQE